MNKVIKTVGGALVVGGVLYLAAVGGVFLYIIADGNNKQKVKEKEEKLK